MYPAARNITIQLDTFGFNMTPEAYTVSDETSKTCKVLINASSDDKKDKLVLGLAFLANFDTIFD